MASGYASAVGGGQFNRATGDLGAVGGGCANVVGHGTLPIPSGGLLASGGCSTHGDGSTDAFDWIGGGGANQTLGRLQSILGGSGLALPNGSADFHALVGP